MLHLGNYQEYLMFAKRSCYVIYFWNNSSILTKKQMLVLAVVNVKIAKVNVEIAKVGVEV